MFLGILIFESQKVIDKIGLEHLSSNTIVLRCWFKAFRAKVSHFWDFQEITLRMLFPWYNQWRFGLFCMPNRHSLFATYNYSLRKKSCSRTIWLFYRTACYHLERVFLILRSINHIICSILYHFNHRLLKWSNNNCPNAIQGDVTHNSTNKLEKRF